MTLKHSYRLLRWSVATFALGVLTGQAVARALARTRGPRFAHSHSHDIIHHASEAIISTDEEQNVVLANPSAAAMFATTVEAMQGCHLSRFISPLPTLSGDATLAIFGDGAGRTGRRATDYAVTGVRASGEAFPLEGSVSCLTEGGARIYTIILRDVTERQQVQAKLSRSHSQLRQLSSALQTVREEERAHIARELHDDLGQLLASLRMDLNLLQQEAPERSASNRLMQGMEENLLTAIQSLRRIATNLRPRALDEGGLYFALQGLRDEFVQRHGIACTLYADEAELRLDDGASTAIFRIVQEALTNIARHAGASNVTVYLYRLDGQLLISIADDGRGIQLSDMEKAQSLGLIGMRERVWGMHGDITISADEPPGTRIEIVLPIAHAPAAEAHQSERAALAEGTRGTSASS
ncbi:PAS domain-containing sensor histidine kinase [Massilia sp. PAMC28688]|uniref:PAS domain-containing sensor histidine kinase n=1 Tax=Massilia sp. PAMC28688 TaxID=2861283 RepID=UPI001C6304D7|nr:PAS domain-containing sensor histidine kinase [Massilia sp. PAMC28688]QYF93950.1 PAS domain-containing sensor histidine kinase [Massilia sp. PAMC28688]